MSRFPTPAVESATGAAAGFFAQIKKSTGKVPNTFAIGACRPGVMHTFAKSAALATVIFAAATATADADRVTASGITGAVVKLAPVVVHPLQDYYDPYTSGHAQRPSSMNHIVAPHFRVPAGYDADVTMHPYTSRIGPCPQGGTAWVVIR